MKPLSKLEDLDVRGKVVFIRVDFNVPLTKDKKIDDDTRIRAALPTIEWVRDNGGRVVLASHLGRPKGERDLDYGLEPVGVRLAELLKHDVVMADDCVGDGVKKNIRDLRERDVLLLENLRFHKEEEENDPEFAKALAENVDVYVDDAFGAAHRAHASVVGMVKHVRDKAPGFLMRKEIEHLGVLLENPARPFVCVIGGAKVSDKIAVLDHLMKHCDAILIGGAMAYTFLAAKSKPVGKSRVEHDKLAVAERALAAAEARKVALLLPEDHVVARTFDKNATPEVVSEIREDFMGLDIGPKTQERYRNRILEAKTVFWNGPMGVFEWPNFAKGTEAVARACADTKAMTVVGGGDSVSAINKFELGSRITHVSTGGGASLELLEGKILPGVKALEE